MTDPSSSPEAGDGTPRWVKVFGIIGVVVILLVVIVLLFGGGQHGPGRHTGGDTPADIPAEAPAGAPAELDGGGHTGPPPGIDHG